MTEPLLAYYAAINASRTARHVDTNRRTYGDNDDYPSRATSFYVGFDPLHRAQ